MDELKGYKTEPANSIRRSTLREVLNHRIERAKNNIVESNATIDECESALKMLNKNKELETLVTLLKEF